MFVLAVVIALGAGCAEGTPSTGNTGNAEEKRDSIRVSAPSVHGVVTSPITISGEARGTWYFEATFPVKLVGENGDVLAQDHATADGDWMTEDFVPFTAALEFDARPQDATLVLMKDNPSGDPSRDDELRIPVRINE